MITEKRHIPPWSSLIKNTALFHAILATRAILTILTILATLAGIAPVPGKCASVTDFGAKGDGVSDDTAAFRAALASADKVINVPAGTWLIKERLVVPESVTLRGIGSASVIKPENIKTVFVPGSFVVLSDLKFDGEKVPEGSFNDDGLILSQKTKDIDLARLEFTGVDRVCIMLRDVDRARIRGNRFGKIGMAAHLVYSSRVAIQDNFIADARLHGIEIWGCWRTGKRPDMKWVERKSEDIIVTGNHVKNGGAGAIWGTGIKRAIFANNIVDGAEDVGLDLEWSQDSVIANNSVRNSKNGGVALFFSCENISITGNTIINDHPITGKDLDAAWWVRSGIWLTYPNPNDFPGEPGHRNITITGNTIHCIGGEGEKSGGRRAIWIGSESRNITIGANTVSGDGKIVGGGIHGVNPMQLFELDPGKSPLNVGKSAD
ncbi:MAG: right-handed parallel beta-helix repeat-containing protein [Opitutaceae bacterium]|jgi:parallel beta-helix repeat protein|nr:right-handed parallel beta-helix repeat-containing protein [Opitutaceae bacterium]